MPRSHDREPQSPRLDETALRSAFTRYRDGDDSAGDELLGRLFEVRQGWVRSIQWYQGVPWDLAHDAVLDAILHIHEKARDRRKSRFHFPRQGLRRFIYRQVRQKLWELRRSARQTNEKRRDKEARSGKAASPFLPRFVHAPKAAAARPAQTVERRALEGIALKAFLRLSKRKRAMALAHFEGVPYAEVARMTGTTERAARVHVSNLLGILRKAVQARGESGAPAGRKEVRRAR